MTCLLFGVVSVSHYLVVGAILFTCVCHLYGS